MAMQHSVQDGRDAARRAKDRFTRPKPIRYDRDTWLVMRDDKVLPAAIITRQHTPDGVEYFRTVTWDLDPSERLLIGRYGSLLEADAAVHYEPHGGFAAKVGETLEDMRQREATEDAEIAARRAEREKLYGP